MTPVCLWQTRVLVLVYKYGLEQIVKAVEKAESVDTAALTEMTYTGTITEEKTVTYEEAAELIEHFETKGYVTAKK